VQYAEAAGGAIMTAALKSRWVWLAVALVLVLVIAAVGLRSSGAGSNAKTKVTAPIALTVNVVNPQVVEWPDVIQASGSIAAWQEAIIGAEVSGLRLVELTADVGDEVKKGQLLARFDDATMRAVLRQQEAAVAEAQANVAEALANAQRAARMRKSGALSEQDITQYLTRGRTASAQLESAQARLHSQQLALEYTRVVAPDDGVISARQATLGMVAAPGTELFRLVRQNRLEWRAELSGAQHSRVHVGDVASLQLADGSTAVGKVRQIAPVLDASSRTGIAFVELDRDTPSSARAGMYASGAITLGQRMALTVPSGAVALRDGHEYVFLLGDDARVLQTKVTVGRRFGDGVEISSGIGPDQQVVASGAAFLNDADMVRVVTANEGISAR
jgi:RND family efflux transporter MFP subunit